MSHVDFTKTAEAFAHYLNEREVDEFDLAPEEEYCFLSQYSNDQAAGIQVEEIEFSDVVELQGHAPC